MGKTKARFSCLCWRSTRGVVEPTKLGAEKIQLPCSQTSCPEARAVPKEPLVSGNSSGCTPPKELVCEKFKQPCAGGCENGDKGCDVSDSNVTKTEPKSTHEEMTCLPDAASSGTQEAPEISAGQMAIAPEVPQKNMKNFAEPFPEERQRTTSQETTVAEESRGVGGDEYGASQKSEPGNETTVLPQAVALVCPAACSAADLPETTTTQPAAPKATEIGTGADGLPETKQTAEDSESYETPISQQAVPPAETETMGASNDAKELLGEEGESQAEQLSVPHDVETKANLSGKKTKSSSQDVGQDAKRNKKSVTPDKAESAPVMDTKTVLTEHEKEDSGEGMARDAQNDGNTSRSKAAPRPRRYQKKKKSSKAKGKRRHGKTGRR